MTDELLLINNNFSLYKTLRYNLSLSYHRLLPRTKGAGIKKWPIKSSHKICNVSVRFSFGASIEKIMFVKMKFCGSKMNSVRTIIFSLLEGFPYLLKKIQTIYLIYNKKFFKYYKNS